MISEQIFSIPLDKEKHIIYAPLKGIVFVANGALVNAIADRCAKLNKSTYPAYAVSHDEVADGGSPDKLQFLHDVGFFRPEPLPTDEFRDKGVQYDAVVLFLTNQCSLRCIYCYASSGEYSKKQMSWEIAKASIDHVLNEMIRNDSSEMTIGFHGGGEPTLNWNIFTRSIQYVQSLTKKNNMRLNVTGSFNGYWSRKVLDYAVRNLTDISLSFDGLPTVQNRQRPVLGGKDSFSRVGQTLKALDESEIRYGIRMTVTNDSVKQLAESTAFICENFKPQKIQIEPVFSEGRAKENRFAIHDLDVFINQFIRGFKVAKEHGIIQFYSGARVDGITLRFCLAACRALVVTTEGDVTTCFETFGTEHPLSDQFIVGHYKGNGDFFIDKEKLNQHLEHTVEKIPYCKDCFCKWHCAGDCTIKWVSESNGAEPHPTNRCYVNQELTKFLLLKKIEESGGLIWLKKAAVEKTYCGLGDN